MPPISLAVLDMAGTTVRDDGAVEQAFRTAADRTSLATDEAALATMLDYVRETMGESKISVFRHLTDGDEQRAQQANAAFESAYAEGLASAGCEPLPGAEAAMAQLREAGIKVALTTGFSRATADAILDALGWHERIDLSLTPADAGRGRPYPDMPLTALLRTETDSVRQLAVVGDTRYDVLSGLSSGARIAAGVLTGAHDERTLREAGATDVCADITAFSDLVLQVR
ncbi:phosphonatase-like hydrolase [Epidermidibacterium keratini]|uniref:Phosphonatase-like hydrolase n=1 Tax=Epidermidibacterium keratini TaxID=1891644 RepID=A0A7L4YHN9_9ACTN|nr:phosphonatase-like hydrolase [Epidermidibacterium keratini]QHB98851.1 phosphonatase-like hydrolase [Epidermidibacterium keratini]